MKRISKQTKIVENKQMEIINKLQEKINGLLIDETCKKFLADAIDLKDNYKLRIRYKKIKNDCIRNGLNRHDLIHALMVTKIALELLDIVVSKRISIEKNLGNMLDFELGSEGELAYKEIQTSLLIAGLWHDTGYTIGDGIHPIKSCDFLKKEMDKITTYFNPFGFSENIVSILDFAERLIVHHSTKDNEEKQNSIEISLIRAADVLDTTYIRQNAEYLQNIIENKITIKSEFKKRNILKHEFSLLLIENVELKYDPINRKIRINISLNNMKDYELIELNRYEFFMQTLILFAPGPRYEVIRKKFLKIEDEIFDLECEKFEFI